MPRKTDSIPGFEPETAPRRGLRRPPRRVPEPDEEKIMGGVAVGVSLGMTTKKSRAVKAALVAFRGLQAHEEEVVLRELGLVRAPRPEALPAGAPILDTAAADELAWVDSLIDHDATPALHPDLMTPEQLEQYNASFRTPDMTGEKTPQKRRAKKGT